MRSQRTWISWMGVGSSARRRPLWLGVGLVLLAAAVRPALAQRPAAAQLLPRGTLAYVRVENVPDLRSRFRSTSMGRMAQDPQMQPIFQQLYAEVETLYAPLKERLNLSLAELADLLQGEVCFAVTALEEGPPAPVLLVDAGERYEAARKLLEQVEAAMQERGGRMRTEPYGEVQLRIYGDNRNGSVDVEGELPRQEPPAGDAPRGPRRRGANVRVRGSGELILFERDKTFVATSRIDIAQWILDAWNGQQEGSFSANQRFAGLMSRCTSDKEGAPQVTWYFDPITLARRVTQNNFSAQATLSILSGLGLDGIRALGGSMNFATEEFDSISHLHVSLDNPRAGLVNILALREGELTPEPWAPSDTENYSTLHWDFPQSYDALARVYDTFRGPGALGNDLRQRVSDPLGIDVEKEVLPLLDGRITWLQWIQKPARLNSETSLVGVKLNNVDAARPLLERVVQRFSDRFETRAFRGITYYKFNGQLGDPPPMNETLRQPEPCLAIVGDYLVGTDSVQFLERIITTKGDTSGLANELDFKLIASKAGRQAGGRKPGLLLFHRPEEGLRLLYDMASSDAIRQQLTQGAQGNPVLGVLDRTLQGRTLPPFAVLARYLAPAGGFVVNDETGMHYTSFSLKRN